MYPTIYHALYDMFGVDWPWAKLLNSFGFFVALAFVIASYLLSAELKRKGKLGLFTPEKKTIIEGGGPDWTDIITNGLIGFIIGWKFIYLFTNSQKLFAAGEVPQHHIFSLDGYWLLGILAGIGFGAWRWRDYKKKQLPQPKKTEFLVYPHHLTGNITFLAAIFGIAGAKLFHLFENPKEFVEFFKHPSIDSFLSGLTVYGGLILGSIGVLLYARSKKINGWHLSDAAAPAMILGYGIGRIGCQVSGDGDWGIANTAPKPNWLSWMPDWLWAYDYPNNVNQVLGPSADTFGHPITDPSVPCFEGYCTYLSPSVFPTPVYETLMTIVIFAILWSLRKKIQIPGIIFSLYLVMNGIERFLIEQIRVNNKFDFLGMTVTQAEVLAVSFVITGIALMNWCIKKNKIALGNKLRH
jgi:phosphatidylglycerol:prolipoprotein diacylglycerol transferase